MGENVQLAEGGMFLGQILMVLFFTLESSLLFCFIKIKIILPKVYRFEEARERGSVFLL